MATFYQDAVKQIGMTEAVLHSLYKKIGRKDHVLFTEELIENKGGTKKELAAFLFKVVNCSLDCIKIMKSGCLEVDALKSEAKCAIKDLAEVQGELLHSKREQINALQASVQTTIKTEMKSYSDIAKKSSGESVTLKKIKTVVQDIVEDRSRNLMIFGLQETAGENLNSKVNEVFEELNVKPSFKSDRVGSKATDRPIKVTLESSIAVSDILRKSKDLKGSDFCHVYLKPDRTLEQRQKHRELVAELKQSIKNSPEKRHFIKNGEVCHVEKEISNQSNVQAETANNSSSGPGVTKDRKRPKKKLLPHHIACNRRPPIGYVSPVTTDTSDCDSG